MPGVFQHRPRCEEGWHDGIFLGLNERADELIKGAAAGAVKTRSMKRKPAEEKWIKKLLQEINYHPWGDTSKPDVPIERPPVEEQQGGGEAQVNPGIFTPSMPPARGFLISREDIKDMTSEGATPGCRGCQAALGGGRAAGRTSFRRSRVKNHLQRVEQGRRFEEAVSLEDEQSRDDEGAQRRQEPGHGQNQRKGSSRRISTSRQDGEKHNSDRQ